VCCEWCSASRGKRALEVTSRVSHQCSSPIHAPAALDDRPRQQRLAGRLVDHSVPQPLVEAYRGRHQNQPGHLGPVLERQVQGQHRAKGAAWCCCLFVSFCRGCRNAMPAAHARHSHQPAAVQSPNPAPPGTQRKINAPTTIWGPSASSNTARASSSQSFGWWSSKPPDDSPWPL